MSEDGINGLLFCRHMCKFCNDRRKLLVLATNREGLHDSTEHIADNYSILAYI
jgi:hypothetical protein